MLKTQFIQAQWSDGTFTDQAQLANALLIKPEVADTLVYAFMGKGDGNKYGLLQGLTQGLGRIGKSEKNYKILGNDEYQWALMGQETRAVPITGVSEPAPAAFPGINFSLFTVPVAEKYFTLGDTVLFGGGMPDQVYARVMEEPYRQGSNWCYTFQIIGNNPNEFVNPNYLQIGKEIGWIGTAFEEGSEGGGMKTATPMWFRNQMGIHRMAWGMTGSAKTAVMVLRFETNKGKQDLWMYKQQYDFLRLWNKMIERELWFSKYNKLNDETFANFGANGRVIKRGSGVEEQITGANTYVTSNLTEELLRHMLLDIMRCSSDAENVKRLLFTGSGGLIAFDQAIRNAVAGLNVVEGAFFINKKTGNELSFGSQFTTYKGFLNTEFTVVYHPMFDDTSIFTELHPITGLPMQSYKMYFLDFSDYDGSPNIQMVTRGAKGENRSLVQWFTAGGSEPNFDGNTGTKMLMRSNGFDGFMCYTLSEIGIMIRNPLSCGMIQIIPQL
jgi:hypothetical protein